MLSTKGKQALNSKVNYKKKLGCLNLFLFFLFSIWFMAIPYINEYVSSRTIKVSKLAIEKPSLDFLFSLSDKSKEKMLQDARLALLGKYSFQNKTSEYTTVKEGDLAETWNSGHYILRKTKFDSNTHAFQAHSLFLLSDLIYAYNTTENKQYLTKGIELFISWYENNPRYNLLPSHYSWIIFIPTDKKFNSFC